MALNSTAPSLGTVSCPQHYGILDFIESLSHGQPSADPLRVGRGRSAQGLLHAVDASGLGSLVHVFDGRPRRAGDSHRTRMEIRQGSVFSCERKHTRPGAGCIHLRVDGPLDSARIVVFPCPQMRKDPVFQRILLTAVSAVARGDAADEPGVQTTVRIRWHPRGRKHHRSWDGPLERRRSLPPVVVQPRRDGIESGRVETGIGVQRDLLHR